MSADVNSWNMGSMATALFGGETSAGMTDLVTSSEIEDGIALIPQLSIVYELKEGAEEGVAVEVEINMAEEEKAGYTEVGVAEINEVGVAEDHNVGVADTNVGAATEGGVPQISECNKAVTTEEGGGLAQVVESSPEELDPETLRVRLEELHSKMKPLFKEVESTLDPEALRSKLEALRYEVKSMAKGVESNPEKFDLDVVKVKLDELHGLIPPPLPPLTPLPPLPLLIQQDKLSSYGYTKDMPPLPPRGVGGRRLGLYRRAAKAPKLTSEEADLVELVRKILSVSEEVAAVVKELKREAGHYSRQASISTPLTETPVEAAFAYVRAMKPLQFGESVGCKIVHQTVGIQ